MIAGLFGISLRASVLLGVAALADLALARRAPAATRHLVWALTIGGLLLLPLASAVLPAWQLTIPLARPSGTSARADATPDTVVTNSPGCAAPAAKPCGTGESAAVRSAPAPTAAVADSAGPTSTPGALAIAAIMAGAVYVAGLLLLIARLVREPFALRRLARAARDITDGTWRPVLDESARQLGVTRRVRLLHIAGDVMPMTYGTLTPTILLPVSADAWTADRRRAVILHELAHVSRYDCLIQRLTAVACALYWPHPGVWWAARRLRVERELACDDRVLAAGAGARDYAGHLLELAHALAPAPATALGMARARHLEHRLLAILDAARNRGSLRRGGRLAAVALAIAVFVPLATMRAAVVSVDAPIGAAPPQSAAAAGQDFTGTWGLRQTQNPGVLQLNVHTARGSHGRTIRLEQLAGLPTDKIASPASAPVHFPIRREAGTFTIDGVCRSGACAGTFVFEPNPAFADALARRGIGRPTPEDQFSLAIADIGAGYLDALAATGYTTPDVKGLVRAARHGVDIGYLREMASLGYRLGTLDALIRLRDHGVDPEYVRGLAAHGLARLSADELVTARDHGIDPDYISGLVALGFTDPTLARLIEARDHGIDPEYIRGMQTLGYRLTFDDLRRTRDHGVDPEYVRGLSSLGYGGLTVTTLLTARDHGVDPAYIRDMAALGYKGEPLEALVRMRDHGVDPAYVRRLQQRGTPHLSVDEIIRRRDHGEGDPDATAQMIAARMRTLWRSFQAWLRA
jgi:beta-lactamase regulating signal transducer with metallopeptidase domain